MRIIIYITALIALFTFSNCDSNEYEFGEIVTPTNITITTDIVGKDANNPYGDGSGVVNFKVTSDNAVSYKFVYNNFEFVSLSGEQTISFSDVGVNTYTVTVLAAGTAGVISSKTIQLEVFANYTPPADLLQKLYGNGSKTWRIKAEGDNHFGLGSVGGPPVEFYGAAPDDKADSGMYDDRYVFSEDGTFTHLTGGTIFGRVGLIDELGSGSGNVNGADLENFNYSDYTENWRITAPGGIETLTLTGVGFIGYYVANHTYQIYDRSLPNEMTLRITDGNNEFDWWFIITSEDLTTTTPNYTYNTLFWEDNFETSGVPDPTKWAYDIGTGNNGWGNGEQQYYTERPENVKVEGGNLIITAIKEDYLGSQYTSARLKTEGLFDFTFGRVEIRAKLPEHQGTWPALWMLGADFATVGWPETGEIDIMEQTGDNKGETSCALHYPGNFGGTAPTETTSVSNATSEFHLYTVEWKPDEIVFAVDDVVFYTFLNDATLPFNKDFFLIFNVALGGSLGGTIDPGFTKSSMEVDYVKVYQ